MRRRIAAPLESFSSRKSNGTKKSSCRVALRTINPHRPLEWKSREIRRPGGFQGHMFQPDTLCLTFAETLSLALCVLSYDVFCPSATPTKTTA